MEVRFGFDVGKFGKSQQYSVQNSPLICAIVLSHKKLL